MLAVGLPAENGSAAAIPAGRKPQQTQLPPSISLDVSEAQVEVEMN
jgi:hypothetical protein